MGKPVDRHGSTFSSEASRARRRTRGTEPSQYPEEEKSIEIPGVAASERGRVQTRPVLAGCVRCWCGVVGRSGRVTQRPRRQETGIRSVLEGRAREGESPVGEAVDCMCAMFPSTTGYEVSCGKLGGPPSKTKYVNATDSELVP